MGKAFAIAGFCLCTCLCEMSVAATWYVDGSVSASGDGKAWATAFKKIQEGIDAASHGDTVIVAEGTYVENIHFNGKNIVLTSTDPLDPTVVAATIIDGNQSGSVVRFSGTENETCILSGLTMRNGRAPRGGGVHGGSSEKQTHATIEHNVIMGNWVWDEGGALYGCDGRIVNNTIRDNRAYNGGALYGCDGDVARNVIRDNSADYDGGGLAYCTGTISNNVISGNRATYGGGGVYRCDGPILGNSVCGNLAKYSGGIGYCYGEIRDCIVWGNYPPRDQVAAPKAGKVTHCCVEGWRGEGEGVISVFPHFVDPDTGDYHLRSWSPCIDAGAPSSDFGNEPQPNGGRINMGAYGNTPEAASKSPDTDDDGLPDDWELHFLTDLAQGGYEDPDGDGKTNLQEYRRGTKPTWVATWYVDVSAAAPGDGTSWETAFTGIQAGINAASEWDVVVVAPGAYSENLHFKGKSITLRSTDPLDPQVVASTVIDGGRGSSVVTFEGTEDETCAMSGFTIRNGQGESGGGICGGTSGYHARVEIADNAIVENTADTEFDYGVGGGVAYCDGTIRNNTITGNRATFGGALYDCDGSIEANIIRANKAEYKMVCFDEPAPHCFWWSGCGGGLYGCDGTIIANTITDNGADEGGGLLDCDAIIEGNEISFNSAGGNGGGIDISKGPIRRNRISGNSAGGDGGGLSGCHGPIQNNTVSFNSAGDEGGGLAWCSGATQNNLILGNSARLGGGLSHCSGEVKNDTVYGNSSVHEGGALYGCTGTIINCILWQNRGHPQVSSCAVPTYSCIERWNGGGEGNFHYSPRFVDPSAGDFHLQSISPCIDAGDPGSDFALEPQPNGGRIDVGAYGNTPEATSKSPDTDGDALPDEWEMNFFGHTYERAFDDPDRDGISNLDEYLRGLNPTATRLPHLYVDGAVSHPEDGSSWQAAFKTIQEAMDAALEGDTVTVAPGTYFENIVFDGKSIVLESSDPLDPDVVAITVIDGNGADSVVRFSGTENEACALAGFTIQNGRAESGGGICGGWPDAHTRAAIRHNLITGNSTTGYHGAGVARVNGTVEHNTISGNTAYHSGGGLYACNGIIQNNLIRENACGSSISSTVRGGGLYECHGIIQHNFIVGNTAPAGGGLSLCQGLVQNNWIVANSAEGGAGLGACDGTVQNNLIACNVATGGAGLSNCNGTIQNNTIVANRAAGNAGGLSDCRGLVRNCIIWGNAAAGSGEQAHGSNTPLFSCVQDWTGEGVGNISDDPLFLDADGPDGDPETYEDNDYRLRPDSPCVNAGENFLWLAWPQKDLEGNCRLSGDRVDMGCYEYGSPLDTDGDLVSNFDEAAVGTDPLSDDTDRDGRRDGLELLCSTDPSVPTPPERIEVPSDVPLIQAALSLAIPGDEIIVAPGTYRENLQFRGIDVTLRGADPQDWGIVGSTILDGRGAGPVVTMSGGETERCVLAGFTISNGYSYRGGGVCGGIQDRHSHATVRDNVITLNRAVEGGAIAYCDGLIRNNIIHLNSAWGSALAYCAAAIRNNVISHNRADYTSAASSCHGTFESNTVYGNDSVKSYTFWATRGTFRNCIIWGNKPPDRAQIEISGDKPRVIHCCVQNWRGTAEGNISVDPQFVDPDGPDDDPYTWEDNDFRLSASSPCVDAGVNPELNPGLDIAGNLRVAIGGRSLTIDMGAYEYDSVPFALRPLEIQETGNPRLIWNSQPADSYVVWSCTNLLRNWWVPDAYVFSEALLTSWTDESDSGRTKFYRVEMERVPEGQPVEN